MIKEICCKTWNDFEKIANEARDGVRRADVLFRGHGDDKWKLETTLDRYCERKDIYKDIFFEKDYYKLMKTLKTYVCSLTSNVFHIPEYKVDRHQPPVGYEFMVYLRHHGFPSPLLDWTESPYIAAFFAFQHPEGEHVAIYSFNEYIAAPDAFRIDEPHILSCGPTITTHRRHFLQQCQYTICWSCQDGEETLIYEKYEDVKFHPGVMHKYIIPSTERRKVLGRLDSMNINAFSLFGNEEGLASTLAFREIELRMSCPRGTRSR